MIPKGAYQGDCSFCEFKLHQKESKTVMTHFIDQRIHILASSFLHRAMSAINSLRR